MKTKFIIATFLFAGVFAFFSCDNTTNGEEQGNETSEPRPIYELSLHQLYLKTEKRYLQMEIDTLEEGSDAHHAAKTALDSVQGNLNEIANLLSETPDKLIGPSGDEIFVEVKPVPIGPVDPDGPIPLPSPSPCNCTIPLRDLMVIVPEGLEQFNFYVKNTQNEIVGRLSKTPEKLTSEQGLVFNAHQLEIPGNLKGEVIIEITKYSKITEGKFTYSFRSELPKR